MSLLMSRARREEGVGLGWETNSSKHEETSPDR